MRRLFFILYCFCLPAFAAADEATERPYDARHYRIVTELDPFTNPTHFVATAEIRFRALKPFETLVLDTEGLSISQVTLKKPTPQRLHFTHRDGKTLEIAFPGKMRKGEEWVVAIGYQGKVRETHHGLFKVTDTDEPDRGPLLFTQLEATHARELFPCNDHPADKATTEVEVTTPKRYQVISNGRLVADRQSPKPGWHTVHWKTEKPHSTYLVALAVAPLTSIQTKFAGKEVSVWVGKTKVDKARFLLETTREALRFLADYLNTPFPWEKYAVVGIPTFLWGGMENTSATFQNQERSVLNHPDSSYEKRRITSLTAHEAAHQWFGDYVTLKNWAEMWLNESFATYMDLLTSKHLFKNDQDEIGSVLNAWDEYFRMEDGPRSQPIVDKRGRRPEDTSDAIVYTKGGQVLRMLHHYLGEEKFRKGLKQYLQTYALANADYQDFFAAMEKGAKEPLDEFRDTWILQRGYPVLRYETQWDEKNKTYQLKVSQRSNHPDEKTVFRFRLPVTVHRTIEPVFSKHLTLEMGKGGLATAETKLTLPAAPEWTTVNPGAMVLARLIPPGEQPLLLQAQKDPDSIARLWALRELASPWGEGKEVKRDVEKALAVALTNDPSPYVRMGFLETVGKMKLRRFPSHLGDTLFELAQKSMESSYEQSARFQSDAHGWRQWRSKLLFSLGRVERTDVIGWLARTLGNRDLALDDLGETALAVATLGDDKSAGILKEALRVHSERGYRYRYMIQYAFGAYENTAAVKEIREMAKTAGSDLMGRLGYVIRYNETLRQSPEWAEFLKEFVLGETRFSDEIKSRLLQTVEDVKTPHVKAMVDAIAKGSPSEQLAKVARKILDKNFSG